jgi:Phosphopantetheine attachment site
MHRSSGSTLTTIIAVEQRGDLIGNRPYDRRVDNLERLLRLLARLGYPGASAEDELLGLGLTSLELIQLDADIEREFAVPADPELMLSATIAELAAGLGQAAAAHG